MQGDARSWSLRCVGTILVITFKTAAPFRPGKTGLLASKRTVVQKCCMEKNVERNRAGYRAGKCL